MLEISLTFWFLRWDQEDLAWQKTWQNFYQFIQGSLIWTFTELFLSKVSLWKQCICVAFNIFSCIVLTISYKILIILGTSGQKKWSWFQKLVVWKIFYHSPTRMVECVSEQMFWKTKKTTTTKTEKKVKTNRANETKEEKIIS